MNREKRQRRNLALVTSLVHQPLSSIEKWLQLAVMGWKAWLWAIMGGSRQRQMRQWPLVKLIEQLTVGEVNGQLLTTKLDSLNIDWLCADWSGGNGDYLFNRVAEEWAVDPEGVFGPDWNPCQDSRGKDIWRWNSRALSKVWDRIKEPGYRAMCIGPFLSPRQTHVSKTHTGFRVFISFCEFTILRVQVGLGWSNCGFSKFLVNSKSLWKAHSCLSCVNLPA